MQAKQLKLGATLAANLADFLDPHSNEIEALLAALPDEVVDAEQNLMRLADETRRFSSAASAAVDHLTAIGRPPDSRRNVALVLTVQAVEEATDRKVTVTRVDGKRVRAGFNEAGGKVVARFLHTLIGTMENQLVVAFERLRREL